MNPFSKKFSTPASFSAAATVGGDWLNKKQAAPVFGASPFSPFQPAKPAGLLTIICFPIYNFFY
jgi:hypothetical protein